MWPLTAYIVILLVYLPGLWLVFRSRTAGRLPLITFCFLGQFLFNAVGSWHVMQRLVPGWYSDLSEIYPTSLASPTYVGMLLMQVLLFYAIAGPYWWWKSRQVNAPVQTTTASPLPRLPDRCFPWIAVTLIVGTMAAWVATGGRFLIGDLIAGRINTDNILEFRSATYGRPDFWLYLIGLRFLPSILFAFVVLRCVARNTCRWTDGLLAACCCFPHLMLAEKSGILYLAAAGTIAAAMGLSARGSSLLKLVSPRACLLLALAFVPTITTYTIYTRHEPGTSAFDMARKLTWRIAGVYSESLAATVPINAYFGEFEGASLPTIRGLLPHHRMNLERAMHEFLWHGRLQPERTGLAGTTPVSVTGEGYLNFGWKGAVGFVLFAALVVVGMQEFLLRLPQGLMIRALTAQQAWLCTCLWTIGLFSTLVSLVHTFILLSGIAGWFLLAGMEQLQRNRRPTDRVSESVEPPAQRIAA
ncbi:MAG: hypothetical protein KDA79_07495 [Planctomycetaceae bacterium]|nr:hypothetical protein [Planctomycetaceae bacterium]